MLKQTISYTDFNDEPRTIEEYFNLNEAELVDMQAHSERGIQADLEDAIKSNDVGQVLDFIKMLVLKSYGKKSADGIYFEKSEELTAKFVNSAYYSDFLLGLIENDGQKGIIFIQGIMPKKLLERATAQVQGQQYAPDARGVFAQQQEVARQLLLSQNTPAAPTEPAYPTPAAPVAAPQETAEEREFREWKANRAAQATPTQFRVPEEEPPLQGL